MTMASLAKIVPWLGLVNLCLLFFQLLSGLKKIKVPVGIHRKSGIALFIFAVIHGIVAFLTL